MGADQALVLSTSSFLLDIATIDSKGTEDVLCLHSDLLANAGGLWLACCMLAAMVEVTHNGVDADQDPAYPAVAAGLSMTAYVL